MYKVMLTILLMQMSLLNLFAEDFFWNPKNSEDVAYYVAHSGVLKALDTFPDQVDKVPKEIRKLILDCKSVVEIVESKKLQKALVNFIDANEKLVEYDYLLRLLAEVAYVKEGTYESLRYYYLLIALYDSHKKFKEKKVVTQERMLKILTGTEQDVFSGKVSVVLPEYNQLKKIEWVSLTLKSEEKRTYSVYSQGPMFDEKTASLWLGESTFVNVLSPEITCLSIDNLIPESNYFVILNYKVKGSESAELLEPVQIGSESHYTFKIDFKEGKLIDQKIN